MITAIKKIKNKIHAGKKYHNGICVFFQKLCIDPEQQCNHTSNADAINTGERIQVEISQIFYVIFPDPKPQANNSNQ
jgi:hypothetical protein